MKIIATGRIHPERADAWFTPRIIWETPSGAVIVVSCTASQFAVTIDDSAMQDIVSGFLEARQIGQVVASSLGFSLGVGYSIELIQVVTESGEATVFGAGVPELKFENDSDLFRQAVEISRKNVFFRMAVRDYCNAISEPMDCAVNCFRAIEAIKGAFGPGSDSQCWTRMHAELGTTRETIDSKIKVFSDPVRHGNWAEYPATTGLNRLEMLMITRNILVRYLQYLETANQANV
jgi:hypothetical protein